MSADRTEQSTGLAPVRFARLPERGVLLGLGTAQLVTLALGIAAAMTGLYAAGSAGLVIASPVWVGAMVVTWVPIGGRAAVTWLPITVHWVIRMIAGQTLYRRRINAPRRAGRLALPGDAARLRQYDDPETGAVMVHDPHQSTLTAILQITHPSFLLLDQIDQHRRVTGWGRVLATCCRSGRIAHLQVLERTIPDSGSGLAQWWATHGLPDDTWVSRTYADLIEHAGPAGERHLTTVSLSLDLRTARRAIRTAGGGMRGAAHVLRQEMQTLTAALQSADLQPSGWYGTRDLAVSLRTAYDPAITASLERSGELGADLASAGPVAVAESWTRLRSDSAHHAVLWVSQLPRTLVYPGFLAPVLLTSGVRRAISLLYHPVSTTRAARDIRKAKVEHISDAAQRARIGQIEDAATTAEYYDVLQQEQELTAGHGILHYSILIAITAPTVDQLDAVVAQIEQSAIQAGCETRRLVGQQAQAFAAAALPLVRPVL